MHGDMGDSIIGGKPDGNIRSNDHDSDKITGTHLIQVTHKRHLQRFDSGFKRERADGKKVHYKDGVITQSNGNFLIKGNVEELEEEQRERTQRRSG